MRQLIIWIYGEDADYLWTVPMVWFKIALTMYVIGLTGNFGTGKTTVGNLLSEMGAVVVRTDEIGHSVLENDPQIFKQLVSVFGDEIVNAGGKIDRRKLGEIAFRSRHGTELLNDIMHALLKQKIIDSIEKCRKDGVGIMVLESALLPRDEWSPFINEFWTTTLPQDVIVERLKKQRNYSENEVLDRIKRQISPQDMVKQADIIIDTNCSPDELKKKVTLLWRQLRERIRDKIDSV
jgi:dephospho-CoA kinase